MFDGIGYDVTHLTVGKDPDVLTESKDIFKTAVSPSVAPNDSGLMLSGPVRSKSSSSSTLSNADGEPRLLDNNGLAVETPCQSPSAMLVTEAQEVQYSMSPSDYKLNEAIGYGSSAIVHLATYLPMGAQVAVKIIDLDRFEKNQIDILRREIQVMTLCRHPNLLRVLASFVCDSQLWIVTPFLSGGSCLDLLRIPEHRNGVMNEAAIATILLQALQGLAYLHENGHIHRDIKAGNLLLDTDGQVQLADFGVSSSLLEGGEGRGGSVRKTFVGTPCWMAPEVMEMTKGYNQKADIWSFGITAYELACGHAPYAKLPAMKVIFVTLSNEPPKFNRHRVKVTFSKGLKELIHACLQKDPNKRPTAEALLKHPFFKQAKRKEWLAAELLVSCPPIQQRARSIVAKVNDKRNGLLMKGTTVNRPETIPEEEWDFSTSSDGGGGGAEEDQWAVGPDKRGRFVVEPCSQLASPATGLAPEENQSSVQSGGNDEVQAPPEIRKGRFSVNPTATTTTVVEGLIDVEEEGRKSRFEVVLPSHSEHAMHMQQRPRQSSQQAVQSVQTCSPEEISSGLLQSAGTSSVYRPSPQYARPPAILSDRLPSGPSPYPIPMQMDYLMGWSVTGLLDHLLHQTDSIRHHILELRARLSYYPPPSTVPGQPPYHQQQQAPFEYSPPYSPLGSVHASQSEISPSPHIISAPPEGPKQHRSSLEKELERQLASLRLENEQLRRKGLL